MDSLSPEAVNPGVPGGAGGAAAAIDGAVGQKPSGRGGCLGGKGSGMGGTPGMPSVGTGGCAGSFSETSTVRLVPGQQTPAQEWQQRTRDPEGGGRGEACHVRYKGGSALSLCKY